MSRITKEKAVFYPLLRREFRAFFDLFKKSVDQANKTDLLGVAGTLSFTTVMSCAPLIAVLFWGFKVFGGLEYAYEQILPYILGFLSEGTGEVVQVHLQKFITQVHTNALGGIGILFLLLTAITTYFTVSKAFLKIWEINKPVSWFKKLKRATIVLTLGPTLLLLSVVLTTSVSAFVTDTSGIKLRLTAPIFAFILDVLLYSVIYALIPMVKIPPKVILIGSLFPAFLLEVAKISYTFYSKKIVNYSIFYGSFAAIPLFLLWTYIAWCITLFGGIWISNLQLRWKKNGSKK